MVPFYMLSTAFLSLQGSFTSQMMGNIDRDERVVFFPTISNEINSTHWQVPIHGWVFEPKKESKKRKAFLYLLRNLLSEVVGDFPNVNADGIFQRRAHPFVVDNQDSKRVKISLGKSTYFMPPSRKDGHFMSDLIVPKSEVFDIEEKLTHFNAHQTINFEAHGLDDGKVFKGTSHIVPNEGISVISDIDDTIKITNVFQGKKELLEYTFLRDFEAVPDMAKVYQTWWKSSQHNVEFHYVSSSVFQLYEELEKFRQSFNFPPATFHLKTIRPKKLLSSLQTIVADPLDTKGSTIQEIIKRFPSRKFILIGDSGEKDPEVYASIAKKFPDQIMGIFIRNVNNKISAQRLEGVPSNKYMFFTDPSELLENNIFKI